MNTYELRLRVRSELRSWRDRKLSLEIVREKGGFFDSQRYEVTKAKIEMLEEVWTWVQDLPSKWPGLSLRDEDDVKRAMNETWSAVAHDVEAAYKNGSVPKSHAVCVLLDLFHPGRHTNKLPPSTYEVFEKLPMSQMRKMAAEVLFS